MKNLIRQLHNGIYVVNSTKNPCRIFKYKRLSPEQRNALYFLIESCVGVLTMVKYRKSKVCIEFYRSCLQHDKNKKCNIKKT